ncbi:MAG TPA: iron-containing alcohol dehydrogenase [Candidatus Omnitrophota bacterium]|nr:iron-containing alcohol dehydrogenase [Candidatus Omnitrophota bacterium]
MHPVFPQETLIPPKILFKKGGLADLAKEVPELGSQGLIVHGASFEKNGLKGKVENDFKNVGIFAEFFSRTHGEPTLEEIRAVIAQGRKVKIDWIAGIGGGSVLDLAKAAAGLFNAKETPAYYQEGGSLKEKGIPFIAIPTTAGSGSEASPNAVIINPEKRSKLSIRDKSFTAKKVILDPELLKGLPFEVMCHSGMDAWVQAYESFISKYASWFSESMALKAMQLISRHLVPALNAQRDEDLEGLMLGSFLSGVAFSHSRLGVIHGIAHPLGVLYDVPHGLICSICFTPSIKLNLEAIGNQKYALMSQAVGMDLLQKVHELQKTLKITSPFKGKPLAEKEKIIVETLASGSTAANPKPITRQDVEYILNEIF